MNYSSGALRYLNHSIDGNYNMISGNQQTYGVLTDCVYGGTGALVPAGPAPTTGCQLTSAWSVNASYEHYWTPQWHQSLAGGYFAVKYNTLANAMLCSGAGGGNGAGVGSTAVVTPGCSNNWNYWGIGSRLQWDVTEEFYLGVEVLYSRLDSAKTFNGLVSGTGYAINTTLAPPVIRTGHLDDWAGTIRMHKDFLP